jgi:hypothetical protein
VFDGGDKRGKNHSQQYDKNEYGNGQFYCVLKIDIPVYNRNEVKEGKKYSQKKETVIDAEESLNENVKTGHNRIFYSGVFQKSDQVINNKSNPENRKNM